MQQFVRGQKTKLSDLTPSTAIEVGIEVKGVGTVDIACFGVDASGKLSDDRYFVFYNQPASPEGAIRKLGSAGSDDERFAIDLSKLPKNIVKLVFTATVDGAATMSQLSSGYLRISAGGTEVVKFRYAGSDFAAEKALIIAEIYLKDVWRFSAVGQGFNGGLSALLKHFGGEEDTGSAAAPVPPPAAAPPPVVSSRAVNLEKQVAQRAPQLLSLVKKARVSLEKAGLDEHRARVALCLDCSGSMYSLYKSGKVQQLAEKVLTLGCHFDDNNAIDVFLFATEATFAGEMTLDNWAGFVPGLQRSPAWRRVGGGTDYSKAIQEIRNYYYPGSAKQKHFAPVGDSLPVYVMYITDGDTSNRNLTTSQIVDAAYQPIFWQFMAIGEEQFPFLHKLDELPSRFVDNAGFFLVSDPAKLPDEQLYSLMMSEYPSWVKLAQSNGLLPRR